MVIRGTPPKEEHSKLYSAYGQMLVELQIAGFSPKYFDGEIGYFVVTEDLLRSMDDIIANALS